MYHNRQISGMSDPCQATFVYVRVCVISENWEHQSKNLVREIREKKLAFKIYNSKICLLFRWRWDEQKVVPCSTRLLVAIVVAVCQDPKIPVTWCISSVIPTVKQLLNEQKTQDRNRHKGTRQKLLSGFFCKGTVWHQELKNGQFGTWTIWHRTI